MGFVLIAAPVGGLITAFGAYVVDKNRYYEHHLIRTSSAMVVGGALATSVIFGLGLLSIKINKAVWRDFSYSPRAWTCLNRGAIYSALTAVGWVVLVGLALLVIALCERCRSPYSRYDRYDYSDYGLLGSRYSRRYSYRRGRGCGHPCY